MPLFWNEQEKLQELENRVTNLERAVYDEVFEEKIKTFDDLLNFVDRIALEDVPEGKRSMTYQYLSQLLHRVKKS